MIHKMNIIKSLITDLFRRLHTITWKSLYSTDIPSLNGLALIIFGRGYMHIRPAGNFASYIGIYTHPTLITIA